MFVDGYAEVAYADIEEALRQTVRAVGGRGQSG